MNTNRRCIDLLRSFYWRLRRTENDFESAKQTILNNVFDVQYWEEMGRREERQIIRFFNEYQTLDPNREWMMHFNVFFFYFRHVIDCFIRETHEWRANHLHFIDEQLWMMGSMMQETRRVLSILENN